MGQSSATLRLKTIKGNVTELTKQIQTGDMSSQERDSSHDLLLDYIKELKYILNRNLRKSKIRKVEKLIIAALQELATLEGTIKTIEPRLRAKSLQTLAVIEKDIKTISNNLANQNFELEKELISSYKKRISLIDEVDFEVGVKKTEVLDVMSTVEVAFGEKQIEEKLKQVEEKHYYSRQDFDNFFEMRESDSYNEYKAVLEQLKIEVNSVMEVSDRVKKRKEYLLYNIDNNIRALDQKAKENEDKIREQLVEECTSSSSSNKNVISAYDNFEELLSADCSAEELKQIYNKLSEVKIKIDQKLKVLENQIQVEELELVPVKENEIRKTTISELYVDVSNICRCKNKLNEIKTAVENIQTQIAFSTYTKDDHIYKNFQKRLEDHKKEVILVAEEEPNLSDSTSDVIKYIDDTLDLLDKNISVRNSTTGDILIDIMSISTSVNNLGSKLQLVENTKEDYESIKKDLLGHLEYLRKLQISSARSNVCQFRDYVLIQIDSYLSHLKTKVNNSRA